MENKKLVLSEFLKIDVKDIKIGEYDKDILSAENKEYYVFTEEEANAKAKEVILYELWAFNADFILRHNNNFESLDNWEYDAAIDSIKKAQENQCESLNGLIRCLISDIDEFVEDAINEDGRGHFIAQYDGCEEEIEYNGVMYYIYRVN